MRVDKLNLFIENHKCYHHPIFKNWLKISPNQEVVGALFHQIRSFCDATRAGHNFPQGLIKYGLKSQSNLINKIIKSEKTHGEKFTMMAGYILNKMSKDIVFDDLYDQYKIEYHLKKCSDNLLRDLPGYDLESGLLIQNRITREIFEERKKTDKKTIMKNLGTTLALEIISNRHLIPEEKNCFIDSNIYNIQLEDIEMSYIKEHWGDNGAEIQHEKAIIIAVSSMLNTQNEMLVLLGAKEFLDALSSLWDVLNAALLSSGYSI